MGDLTLLLAGLLFLPKASPKDDEPRLRAMEHRMAELINVEREARALAPLRFSPELTRVAREYSRRMAASGKVRHGLERSMEERIRKAVPETCRFGENVSKHASVDYSLGDLLLSEGHRENLLNPDFTLVGVGIAPGEDGFFYITQELAGPCDPLRRR